ncbi:LOW QUALITY PROTEIN: hypothetical protein Cgig2_020301 [Carnegiea gigantea]|uniref:Uncharacterized protein n=1 Tax=Carnegiea gigantea TaxID=171969 RepID=A0A9Q1K7H1_9CARY|nr:LOW QUALITY PROTEIN: hypothetical protein Cgig2_020301 [Carnegiea gigantea]
MSTASRRTSAIHYYKNFISLYPSKPKQYTLMKEICEKNTILCMVSCLFINCCKCLSLIVHERAMEKIREKEPDAYHLLRNNDKLELWATFKFDTSLKYDDNTNNFVESFNHAIVKFRGLPILIMLEEIKKLIGSRFVKRLEKVTKIKWQACSICA